MQNVCLHCSHATVCLGLSTLQFTAKNLKRGEHLCYQGQQSTNLYILRSGTLKSYTTTSHGEEFIMGFYLPPDLFGWESIDDTNHSISIVALEESNICIVPTETLFAHTQKATEFGTQLLRMVSRRIQQDNVALLRTTALQRVTTFLLQLALRYQQIGFAKNQLHLKMTHQDIANYLRITPSTISRLLHQLEKKKLIAIKKHVIQLLDSATIQQIADNG